MFGTKLEIREELQTEYGIKITSDEMHEWKTIKDIINLVEKKKWEKVQWHNLHHA